VLSRINRAIEHTRDDETLLGIVCQTIVEVGPFLMTWVGLVDSETREVRPVASFGRDDGYLDFVQVRLDGVRSEGPTGQAVRQDCTVVCDDIATDPRMATWRDEALRRGYRSSIGLPLRKGGAMFGVLTVYADQPNRFNAGEIELLEELAGDVAFGLATLEEAAERRRAEAALTRSEQRFRAMAETLLDPFVILRAVRDGTGRIVDFVYEFANRAACLYNHLPYEELIGKSLLALLPGHEAAGLIEAYARTVETGEPLVLDDLAYADAWGSQKADRVFDVRASKLGDAIAYTWRDVTERRQAERLRSEELERRVRERTAALEVAQQRAFELAGLSAAMLDIGSREEVGRRLLDAAARASGALDGLVALVDPQTQELEIIGSLGFEGIDLKRVAATQASVRTPIRDVFESGQPIVLENAVAYRKRYGPLTSMISHMRDRARVAFPLRARNAIIGGVALGFAPRPFGRDELDFFASIANAAALALDRLRLSTAESHARGMLDTVVAQMPVGVTVTGRDGRIQYRNSAFDRILEGAEIRGGSESNWLGLQGDGSRYRSDELPAARSLASGEVVVNEEMKLVRADGKSAVIMQTSAPVHDPSGDIIGAVVVTTDVTDRKEAEQLRDAFLGVLSHELRTPVTTISGCAQFLVARGPGLRDSVRAELARDIAAESDRLARMIDDLLVLARAERGVDLTARNATLVQHRLRAVVKVLAGEWPNRTFACRIPSNVPPVTGDDGYLDQVLWNLLSNAAKYGRREVTAQVHVHADAVEVTILDDGPGIPPAEHDRIFELFTRVQATSKLPGTGIGLFVVRRLVEAMGGRIALANRPEGGAAFTVTLPRYPEQPVEAGASGATTP
jgi:PAS domain S-box-containing protein